MTGFLPRRSRARRRDDAPRIFTALLLRKWPRLVHGAAHDSLPYREYCISGAVAIIVAQARQHRQFEPRVHVKLVTSKNFVVRNSIELTSPLK